MKLFAVFCFYWCSFKEWWFSSLFKLKEIEETFDVAYETARSDLNLLVEKRRIFFIKKIIKNFSKLCSNHRGEIEASLISSKNLSKEDLNEISSQFSQSLGAKIKFNYSVDESLIGGVKIQFGSLMVDTSIKNKLKKYEKLMIEN